MRPYYLLVLAIALIITCSPSVPADATFATDLANHGTSEGNIKRLLRAEKSTEEDGLTEEERGFSLPGLSWFKFWRLRRVANKVKTTDVVSGEKSTLINSWVKKDLSPEYVYKNLGLAKQGDKAMQSQNYRLFEVYTEGMYAKNRALYNTWMAQKMTPDEVYVTLKLDKLTGAKVAKSMDFRRYEVYVFKWYERKDIFGR